MRIVVSKLAMMINEGDTIPPYYGIAYWKWNTMEAVCYPIPLNLVVGVFYLAAIWAKSGHKLWRVERDHRIYDAGVEAGKRIQRVDLERLDRAEARLDELRKQVQSEFARGWRAALNDLEQRLNERKPS